ncbi:MAG: type II toxin-antitoxin system ParD family antitoxin [Sphingomonadales bacterium]|nr:type II toxin-antitoxin system ParD family antitoxin [Sphingomonadales bacterium]PIX67603.1 MAG: type II toxin-antitoxin system ParD family antitoxin [Sphingomonadales bacterium CG_4_10_14_3_um_filter_58_15]NCO47465.1 type II toxin-antitoxin system ParD family antitoxin [Sphingomonadales bacterium]NCP00559.1 type II toxin-antitoxin system ParD family antitoxin [Sphingomonadales bacterium]NCP26292.1 type II toxin-antitoxin system ParD family antitoxin [Sphingomonadales bacterium]
MATVRKTITLSESQDAWIKSQIARGEFTNDSEYIRDLVRRDQSQQDRLATLREAIAEGLDSGTSDKSLDDIWSAAEDRAANG